MRFSEIFRPVKQEESVGKVKHLADLGALSFGPGITDKNQTRTPHYEIEKCIEMYENNPLVNSGIEQMMLWLFPNTKMKFDSQDEKSVKFAEDWHNKRSNILFQVKNIFTTNLICGNAPVETYRTKSTNKEFQGKEVLDNISSFNDMSRIYVNVNGKEDGSDAYILELKWGTEGFWYRGKFRQPRDYTISYYKNYKFTFATVHGIALSKDEMKIWSSGWSRDNLYGRSALAAAIDAHNVYTEIVSSWDTIAKTRQTDQKIISLADNNGEFMDVSQDKLDDLGEQLENNDKSYILFNAPLKFVQQDINTSGNYDLMEGVFDLVRRMLVMSLIPNHLTPWSDSATTQGSDSAMPPFMSRLKAKQNEFINWYNENILSELIEAYNLSDDLTLVIDEPKVRDDSEYIRTINDLMRDEIIDKSKAQEYLAKLGIIGEDILKEDNDSENNNSSNEAPQAENVDKSITLEEKTKPSFDKIKKQAREQGEVTRKWKQVMPCQHVNNSIIHVVENEVEYILFENGQEVKRLSKKNMTKQKLQTIVNKYKNFIKEQ